MKNPNVLIIADREDVGYLYTERRSESWNIFWKVIDYDKLYSKISELQGLVTKHEVDFVMYSRNDQVANRISIGPVTRELRTGYSSLSGIDKRDRIEQMVACFNDFMECGKELNFNLAARKEELTEGTTDGTFSLIFDTEQLGGVKYGLPRILNLLNRYNVKATFFVTNLVRIVYPNILEQIQEQGHEVGLHGLWHEYLSGISSEEQKVKLGIMTEDFCVDIHGVNFLGRMDENTLSALVDKKINYFVYGLINRYYFLSYPRLSTVPSLIRLPHGNIWALPISVETYGSPWFSIKNMLDSAISQGEKYEFQHINILCHSFRDGNLQHIEVTEKLLQHLTAEGRKSVTLSQMASMLDNKRDNYPEVTELKGLLESIRGRISPPKTKRDFISIIPQNLMLAYRLTMRRHNLF